MNPDKLQLNSETPEKEVSPEFVREIEESKGFFNSEKIEILLVKAGLKPASTIMVVKDWRDWSVNGQGRELTENEISHDSNLLIKSGTPHKVGGGPESLDKKNKKCTIGGQEGFCTPEGVKGIEILIGNTPAELKKLELAWVSGSHKLIGEAMGIPQTAIDAFTGKRPRLDLNTLPDEIKNSEAFIFMPTQILSADNWQEELKIGQKRADFIKRVSPLLYNLEMQKSWGGGTAEEGVNL